MDGRNWKVMKWDKNRWKGEQNEERTNENCLENSRPFTYNNWSFGEQLHLYPSYYHDLPSKSLSFLFNQFAPYFHDISITKYFSWKFKFTFNINLPFYLSKPSNFYCHIIVRKFTGVTENGGGRGFSRREKDKERGREKGREKEEGREKRKEKEDLTCSDFRVSKNLNL